LGKNFLSVFQADFSPNPEGQQKLLILRVKKPIITFISRKAGKYLFLKFPLVIYSGLAYGRALIGQAGRKDKTDV
jgi:hypothetical protein